MLTISHHLLLWFEFILPYFRIKSNLTKNYFFVSIKTALLLNNKKNEKPDHHFIAIGLFSLNNPLELRMSSG